jgi:hypothetical protein
MWPPRGGNNEIDCLVQPPQQPSHILGIHTHFARRDHISMQPKEIHEANSLCSADRDLTHPRPDRHPGQIRALAHHRQLGRREAHDQLPIPGRSHSTPPPTT